MYVVGYFVDLWCDVGIHLNNGSTLQDFALSHRQSLPAFGVRVDMISWYFRIFNTESLHMLAAETALAETPGPNLKNPILSEERSCCSWLTDHWHRLGYNSVRPRVQTYRGLTQKSRQVPTGRTTGRHRYHGRPLLQSADRQSTFATTTRLANVSIVPFSSQQNPASHMDEPTVALTTYSHELATSGVNASDGSLFQPPSLEQLPLAQGPADSNTFLHPYTAPLTYPAPSDVSFAPSTELPQQHTQYNHSNGWTTAENETIESKCEIQIYSLVFISIQSTKVTLRTHSARFRSGSFDV